MSPEIRLYLEKIAEHGSLDAGEASSAATLALEHIRRLEAALTGIMRGAPYGSHAFLTAAAALDRIGPDGLVETDTREWE